MTGFARIAFNAAVKAAQERHGSRAGYARLELRDSEAVVLGPEEREFIESRESFYLASVNSEDWPYIQHRGGPRGFLRVLSNDELAFAQYAGNRQYVTEGNLSENDRVSLFLMDYPSRSRLKILGHAQMLPTQEMPELAALLAPPEGYKARAEALVRIKVVAFDWNCHQHIVQRFTIEELQALNKEKDDHE